MTSGPDRRFLLLGGGLLLSGATGVARPARAQLQEAGGATITAFGARPRGDTDASVAFDAAFKAYSDDRTSPPGLKGWGVGAVISPRGAWTHRTPIRFADSQIGFAMRGEAPYATTHLFDIATGGAVPLKTYVAVTLSDFYLRNVAGSPGDSVGVSLDPEGGGGPLTIRRVAIDGFGTAIRLAGTGNGDKTLVEQVSFGTTVGFDNGRNKQAVGWTFLNCSGACALTHFRLGGAGEVAVAHYVGNVFGSFIDLPESSGNAGGGNFPARVTVSGTQLEYHGTGPRLLIDASRSTELTDRGGTNADIVLREVTIVSGATPPDPKHHAIIQVGNERAGSDAVRVRQEGGWIEGVIRHGSEQQGALNRRWSFRDALRAPAPETAELTGIGSHPLMEWRANENVPVDQYRGGQSFTGAIDAQKAFLWRHVGAALLNTGVDAKPIGGRYGGNFTIGGFPPGTTQLSLAVFLDEPLTDGHDLQVVQFTDAAFRSPLGTERSLPPRTPKGLHRIHDQWHILEAGELYVRVTLPTRQTVVRGAVVPFYFPYMGS
jgi:hypothetical protein